MAKIKIFNGSDSLVYESDFIQEDKINEELIKILKDIILYEDDKIIITGV